MVGSEDNNKQTRSTISLKSSVKVSNTKNVGSGAKTVEVEIKRKKHAITVDNTATPQNISSMKTPANAGNLTDEEFKARVRALQDAMKEEETAHIDEVVKQEEVDAVELKEEVSAPVIEDQKQPIDKASYQKRKQKPVLEKNIEPVVFKSSDYYPSKPAVNVPEVIPEASIIPEDVMQATKKQHHPKPKEVDDDKAEGKKGKVVVKAKQAVSKKAPTHGKVSRTVLDRVFNDESEERVRSEAALKRARQKHKNSQKVSDVAKIVKEVTIPDFITVGELANRMAVRSADVIKYLMRMGIMATLNQSIDGDTAELICSEFGHIPKRVSDSDVENDLQNIVDDPKDLSVRPPVVAIMGHVDHGKTTLLDTIRKTSIAQKEAGGITQHVAAYQIDTKCGKKITFIDTPGHAAFSNIRSRGAVITDIIVLVVAADDGIKDQTIEAIQHAKSQSVPIVVAINKIDKPNINIDRVKTELMNHEVILEDFGGEVLSVEISALKNLNLDGLVETILLQAEVLELLANKKRNAVGTILESRVDKGKGIISSVIIQHGTIKPGDIFVAGSAFGKVRTIYDDKGRRMSAAGPASPVEVVGFDSSPEPGDVLSVVDSDQKAKEIAEYRKNASQKQRGVVKTKTIDQMIAGHNADISNLNIMVKADVYGSLEAIVASIEALHHPEIKINIIERSVGIISESDIDFAKNTGALIIGFNVNLTVAAKEASKANGTKILMHNVIYHITEEIKREMSALLSPIVEEKYTGTAEVRRIFVISRYGTIAGCYVIDGTVKRADSKIKVKRDGKYVFEGKMRSMRHEKDEIKEARQSHECGILAEGFNDFIEGDLIECYEIIQKSRLVD